MKRTFPTLARRLALATALGLLTVPAGTAAFAQTAAETAAEAAGRAAAEAAGRIFTQEEARIIRQVLGAATGTQTQEQRREEERHREEERKGGSGKGNAKGGSKDMPPGLAKRDSLPPGLARQLERNGRLPPGLEKRRLPDDLQSRLGPAAAGTERVIVDNDVLLIETGTQIILDILQDVIAPGRN